MEAVDFQPEVIWGKGNNETLSQKQNRKKRAGEVA
jgi:hypothetical protein